ncbi:BTB/POZ protein [Haematococcus lacustris]
MQGRYGGRFHSGFAAFLKSGELTDVQVVVGSTQYHAHMLLLAYHSEFFRRAVTSHFREGKERVIHLGIDDPAGVWPTMLEFFYSDELVLTRETVLPMLALARQLMVKSIEDWCMDFAQNSLETGNAIQYLNQAVQFNCDSFRDSCVTLVAEGFPASFSRSTDGLPTEVMLEVLQHSRLLVQTEEQVLVFVLNYVARHELSADTRHQLFSLVRLPFLSNDRLAQLTLDNEVPKDLLLPALAFRLTLLDRPDRMARRWHEAK